jgi:DNA-binding MarR family transcriptional regulator
MRAVMFHETPIPELEALPLAQMRLLWTVHHAREATMKDFSERLSVSQSTVTQLADRLVRRGLVERLDDPEDRRVVLLRTSPAGRTLLERAEGEQRETHQAIWAALSASEQRAVLRGLEMLARAGEALRAAQGRPLPPLSGPCEPASKVEAFSSEPAPAQPVVDLMARRVRGRAPGK